MSFQQFKLELQENVKKILKEQTHLFVTNVSKDEIWDTYLSSFPEESRQEHNCNSCRQFLKPYANLVVIQPDFSMKSIWDFESTTPIFKEVGAALNKLVTSKPINNVFVTKFLKLGTDFNFEQVEGGENIKWEHFHVVLPSVFLTRSSDSEEAIMGQLRASKEVFKRSLDEITLDAVNTVLELISQNSLYRGIESKGVCDAFLLLKKEYDKIPADKKENYAWKTSILNSGAITRIRNSSIGTLLTDISEGKELDHAVRSFESIMAPANYKRPTAIVTASMVKDAQKQLEELGMTESLGRRYATPEDIKVNNVLFIDRSIKPVKGVFDSLVDDALVNPKKLTKVEEVSLEDFITKIVPTATSIEFLLENKHGGNLVSLIAPKSPEAPSLFKWPNNFSWSYTGNVADSIKENVKAAGGKVDGVLRFSIQWNESGNNNIDFDAHCLEPNGNEIYYGRKQSARSKGELDVDIISPNGEIAVENITWSSKTNMLEGKYKFFVNNYSGNRSREGFTAEIEYEGEVFSYEYPKALNGRQDVTVCELTFSKDLGITITKSLPAGEGTITSRKLWGIDTNKFQKVTMLTSSPNFWDDSAIGNKHFFFILDKCTNSEESRGFYNEFLREDLLKQKRVFEALGDKLKVEHSPVQLSGVGFSITTKAQIICKVTGSFARTIKINI